MQGMPSSAAATGLVDHVVPVEVMPTELIAYHRHITAVSEKKDGNGHRKELEEEALTGRGQDDKERPLARVAGGQNYIAYNKGGIAMYALKEAIGEAAVNRALARFVREYAFKTDPYPRPDDLIRLLRAEAGPDHQQLRTLATIIATATAGYAA